MKLGELPARVEDIGTTVYPPSSPIASRPFAPGRLGEWAQMKQSLEKLHRGIVVPEVQQDPQTDTLTESLTEA
ncbi:GRAM domain-containing protein 1A isoform X1 [Lates japonicus]|uniref:GRAM domain-containing protein 1A isoform X1 n=1 Tax=Lates japonicus TaxID=270547 RepID=A0AAD3NGI9_LATJO|nr:GRAM domain-containing protein 1A isoform X1 [Lates japonicus]